MPMDRPAPTPEPQVLEALTAVFMEHGFGGATLSLFTQATGLKRPSLYHRFPGGKLDMALAVARFSREQFFGEVLAPLAREGDPGQRVEETVQNMQRFYEASNNSCLMDGLSLGAKGEDRTAVDQAIREMFVQFIDALTRVAKDFGASPEQADRRAQDAVIRLEGSLVIARGTGDASAFQRTLTQLPGLLSGQPVLD